MEIRKFLVEIKPDGQVISRQMAEKAYRDLEEEIQRYPDCYWADWKAAYLNGASSILAKLRIKF